MPRPRVTEIPPASGHPASPSAARCAPRAAANAPRVHREPPATGHRLLILRGTPRLHHWPLATGHRPLIAPAFTLTELIVVAVVITLIISLGLPAFTALNRAGTFSQVQSTMTSMATRAQIRSYDTKAGLLITRARKNEQRLPQPYINDPDRDNPAQNHQVVRLVTRAPYPDRPDNPNEVNDPNNFDIPLNDLPNQGKDGSTNWPYYRQVDETEPVVLSETTWAAPDYAADARPGNSNRPLLDEREFEDKRLVDLKTRFPAGGSDNDSESLVNAFFIIFDQGQTVRDAFTPEPRNGICDEIKNPFLRFTFVNSSDDLGDDHKKVCRRSFHLEFDPNRSEVSGSARGAVLYDRRGLVDAGISDDQAIDRWKYLRNQGTPIFARRYGGEMVQGQRKVYE